MDIVLPVMQGAGLLALHHTLFCRLSGPHIFKNCNPNFKQVSSQSIHSKIGGARTLL